MPTEPTPATADDEDEDAPAPKRERPARRSAGMPKTVLVTVLATLLVVATAVSAFLAIKYHGEVRDDRQAAADVARAEQIAQNYAVGASTIDFEDIAVWLKAVKTGVNEDMAKRFDAAAPTMRELAVTVRLKVTGTPVVSKVISEAGGVYKVAAVVDTQSTSAQAPGGTQGTSPYTITVDKNQNWLITDAGDPLSKNQVPIGGTAPSPGAAPSGAPTPAPTP